MSIQEVPAEQLADSSTTTTKRSGRILAGRASQTLNHGSKYHTRRKSSGGRCPSSLTRIGFNGPRTGRLKALFRKAGSSGMGLLRWNESPRTSIRRLSDIPRIDEA